MFCGPPGIFSVWESTPSGKLFDREVAELLGQMAVRAGAMDYRIYPLATEQAAVGLSGEQRFIDPDELTCLRSVFISAGGVPQP